MSFLTMTMSFLKLLMVGGDILILSRFHARQCGGHWGRAESPFVLVQVKRKTTTPGGEMLSHMATLRFSQPILRPTTRGNFKRLRFTQFICFRQNYYIQIYFQLKGCIFNLLSATNLNTQDNLHMWKVVSKFDLRFHDPGFWGLTLRFMCDICVQGIFHKEL